MAGQGGSGRLREATSRIARPPTSQPHYFAKRSAQVPKLRHGCYCEKVSSIPKYGRPATTTPVGARAGKLRRYSVLSLLSIIKKNAISVRPRVWSNCVSAAIQMAAERKSLHQLEGSKKSSIFILVINLICIALIAFSHVGLSAQVVTNAPPPPPPSACSGGRRLASGGFCSGTADDNLYTTMGRRSSDPALPSLFDETLRQCSQFQCGIASLTDGTCVKSCFETQTAFTTGCTSCIGNFSYCSAVECFAGCLREINLDCLRCVDTKCTPEWSACSGFNDNLNFPNASGAQGLGPSTDFWNIGGDADIAFFTALNQLFSSGSYGLGVLLLLASGIKPYAECLVLLIIWFVPLPKRTRGQALRWINRSSRWSLLDMLVVISIGSAIHFTILSGTVSVILETRVAIYTFAIMACILTPVGEWMTFRSTVHGGFEQEDPAHLGCCGLPLLRAVDEPMQRDALKRRSWLLLLVSLPALALTAASIFMDHAVTWSIEDLTTGDIHHVEATFAELMLAVTKPVTDSPAGGTFMAVIYFAVVIFAPLTAGAAMVIIGVVPAESRLHLYALRWAQAVNPYASLDVMLVGLLVFVSEFDRLIAALADGVTGGCPGSGVGASQAIRSSAGLGTAIYVAVPAILLTWIAQILTAVHAATCEAHQVFKSKSHAMPSKDVISSSSAS